jgi:hypothetical protein
VFPTSKAVRNSQYQISLRFLTCPPPHGQKLLIEFCGIASLLLNKEANLVCSTSREELSLSRDHLVPQIFHDKKLEPAILVPEIMNGQINEYPNPHDSLA